MKINRQCVKVFFCQANQEFNIPGGTPPGEVYHIHYMIKRNQDKNDTANHIINQQQSISQTGFNAPCWYIYTNKLQRHVSQMRPEALTYYHLIYQIYVTAKRHKSSFLQVFAGNFSNSDTISTIYVHVHMTEPVDNKH